MTATITLDDDDQSTVRRMLTYLYTLDYDDGNPSQAMPLAAPQDLDDLFVELSSKPEAFDDATASHCKRMNNVRVYAIAEKYNIPALKVLAMTKFKNYETARNSTHNREVINAIFSSTPDSDSGLRNIVISMSAKASDVEENLKEEGLAPVIRDHGNFGLGMLREVVKKRNCALETQQQALGSLHADAMQFHKASKRARGGFGRFQ